MDRLYNSAMVSLKNMEEVSQTLNDADIEGLIKSVESLSGDATEGLSQAMAKVSAIDVDTLNRSIKSLNDTVEPFANFMRRFQ